MKKYVMNYRQRFYFCKKCDLHIEHIGNGASTAKCPCCGVKLHSLKLELDNLISVKKSVTPNK